MKKPTMPAAGEPKRAPSEAAPAQSASKRPSSAKSSAKPVAKRTSGAAGRQAPGKTPSKPSSGGGQKSSRQSKASRAATGSTTSTRTGSSRTAPVRTGDAGAGGWLRSLRLSGFSVLLLGILILGVVVLAPNLKTFLEQRQQIAALEAGVADTQAKVDAQTAERERWNDQSYVMTQARDRLFYALPGEVSYIIINDIDPASLPASDAPVSDTLVDSQTDWLDGLLSSLVATGYSPAPVQSETPAPAETPPATQAPAPAEG
ncbi:septum formation initiator family protein [Plantibacter flavus]|uniref:septum formation initiator family protein n=1 Tax=Plantibacter flavus TaxID=150123 RepID=UPI003F1739A2